jgi:hypothetical protein
MERGEPSCLEYNTDSEVDQLMIIWTHCDLNSDSLSEHSLPDFSIRVLPTEPPDWVIMMTGSAENTYEFTVAWIFPESA